MARIGADVLDVEAFTGAVRAVFSSGSVAVDPPKWKGAFWEATARERSERERARRARASERSELAAPSAHSLEEVTLEPHVPQALPDLLEGSPCSEGQAGVKVVRYQDGLKVVVFQSRSSGAARSGSASRVEPSSEPSRDKAGDTERAEASIRRSRGLVVHRARCLGPTAMWTFTKRGKFASADDVWRAWRAFTQLMRRRYEKKFRFVAVPELHADGETWHLHVLVDRFYMVESLRTLWYRALGGTGRERGDNTPGNVDAKSLRSGRWSARRAAHYVAKYVGKGFERIGSNRRVFSGSVGLVPLAIERRFLSFDAGIVGSLDIARRWICEAFGVEWFPARFVFRPLWQCAMADVKLSK